MLYISLIIGPKGLESPTYVKEIMTFLGQTGLHWDAMSSV